MFSRKLSQQQSINRGRAFSSTILPNKDLLSILAWRNKKQRVKNKAFTICPTKSLLAVSFNLEKTFFVLSTKLTPSSNTFTNGIELGTQGSLLIVGCAQGIWQYSQKSNFTPKSHKMLVSYKNIFMYRVICITHLAATERGSAFVRNLAKYDTTCRWVTKHY